MQKLGQIPEGQHSFVYKFPKTATLDQDSIIKFIENAITGKADEYFKTQKPPKYPKFSRKVVGKTF